MFMANAASMACRAGTSTDSVMCAGQLHNTHHAADKVLEAAKGALADLQLGYLDLFLMHWPVSGNKGPSVEPPIKETWQARIACAARLCA